MAYRVRAGVPGAMRENRRVSERMGIEPIERIEPRSEVLDGAPIWRVELGAFRVLTWGRGAPERERLEARRIDPGLDAVAWLRQCHSNEIVRASPGLAGAADALLLDAPRLAAAIATADCVPIVVVGARRAVAIHAGWRGLASGIVARALERLGEASEAAFVGPAIGPCCYEVGEEVAAAVVAASDARSRLDRSGGRPHLDLPRAAFTQLERAGVGRIATLERCTRCHPDLSSHRRDAERAGRNLTIVWRRADTP